MSRLFSAIVEFTTKGDAAVKNAADQIGGKMQNMAAVGTAAGEALQAKFSAASTLTSRILAQKLQPALAGTAAAFAQNVVVINNYGAALVPFVLRAQKLEQVLVRLEKQLDALAKVGKRGVQGGGMGGTTKAAEELNAELDKNQGKLDVMSKQLQNIGHFATLGFASITGIIGGFVRQGLAGTVQGEQLSLAFERLSMQIAAVFLPIVEKVTGWIEKLVDWFRGLSGAQQDQIMRWVVTVATVLLAVTAYTKVIGILAVLASAYEKMKVAQIGFNLATLNFIGLVAAVAGAVYAVNTAWDEGQDAVDRWADHAVEKVSETQRAIQGMVDHLKSIWDWLGDATGLSPMRSGVTSFEAERKKVEKRRDVMKAGGAIESLEATWNRIAQASVKLGRTRTLEEQLADQHRESQEKREEIRRAIEDKPPPTR